MRAVCGNGVEARGQIILGDLVGLRFSPNEKDKMNEILNLRFRNRDCLLLGAEGPDKYLAIVTQGRFPHRVAPLLSETVWAELKLDAEGVKAVE